MVGKTPDDRGAIVARREAVAGMERPAKLSSVDVGEEVRKVRETSDTYKVYVREWLVVFVSDAAGDAGVEECRRRFREKYEGRVRDEDVRVEGTSRKFPDRYGSRLMLCLPNVRGEFKTLALAEEFAGKFDGAVVVGRNSRDEYELKNYGLKKLLGK